MNENPQNKDFLQENCECYIATQFMAKIRKMWFTEKLLLITVRLRCSPPLLRDGAVVLRNAGTLHEHPCLHAGQEKLVSLTLEHFRYFCSNRFVFPVPGRTGAFTDVGVIH